MIEDFLNKSIVIQRAIKSKNSFSDNSSQSWSTHITIDGNIDYIGGQKQNVADQFRDKATHILICSVGNDIIIDDRVVYSGITYNVLYPDTVFDHHMEVLLQVKA